MDSRLVGTIRLHDISKTKGVVYLGIAIFAEDHRGQGMGSKAISRITQFPTEDIRVSTVLAGTLNQKYCLN